MLFAGKTKSGNKHLWPRWWCFLFGGTFRQHNGGYGTVYSIPKRVRRYYREGWREHYTLLSWIWNQSPYGLDQIRQPRRGLFSAIKILWRFAICDHMNSCKTLVFPDTTELTFCTRCGRVLWCMDDGDCIHNMHLMQDRLDRS